jgi:methionyl-tRNA synthetase
MSRCFTVCTAIPYVNSVPHIGNILTDLCGDITARYARMNGEEVFFQVGTDENGLKIKEAAEAAGRPPLEFVAEIADRFRQVFDGMAISYDDFLRTTEPRHIHACQELFRRLEQNGYVYLDTYEGWYDVSTETFFREEDLIDGKSPDGNPVRWVSEPNYFFRLSAFADRLLEHIQANPSFIVPENRRNEVLAFIRQGLRDVCITRKNPGWGIPVPDRDDLVIYVWFDAVINYISCVGWPQDGWEARWPARVQWVGKDILTRFHATLWPAMLMGAELPLFDTVAAHGWVLLNGEKISKSRGNVVRPLELADELAAKAVIDRAVAVDAIRHYLSATMSLESDSTYSDEDFELRYNADLANDLGNALNRSLSMAHKFTGSQVPDAEPEPEAVAAIREAREAQAAAMTRFDISAASAAAFGLVRWLNKYIDTRAPWALSKAQDPALGPVMVSMLLSLRAAEGLVRPFLPTAADRIADQLGLPPLTRHAEIGAPESLPPGTNLASPQPIFPRLEVQRSAPAPKPNAEPVIPPPSAMSNATEITIEDFAKVQFRIARILEAEPIEGADKLYKLQVVVGEERRQIVSGIRPNYSPEDLIGRQIVVVTNLKPAKLRGVESAGMLLAATDESGGAILLQPDREAPEGAPVK